MEVAHDQLLEFDEQALNSSIAARFAQVVRRFGQRTALVSDEQCMTYAELDAASNQVANWLLEQAGPTGDPVALLFGHGTAVVVALLGVLKSGRAFCALEPYAPDERNVELVNDLRCRFILTETDYLEQSARLAGDISQVVDIYASVKGQPAVDPQLDIAPNTLATITFTSGSTGRPKGVSKLNSYYVRRTALTVELHSTGPTDVLSLLTYVSHGSGLVNLFDALLNGATLCTYELRTRGAQGLTEWILRHKVTQLHMPNTALRIWSESMTEDEYFPAIRILRFGLRLYATDIEPLWHHLPPDACIVHGLSAAETGIICRLTLRRDSALTNGVVPVGYPVPGVEILLVNDVGQPVAPGEVGEIWVRSPFLAEGYWRRPELTDERFVPDPQDGSKRIYHLGDLGRLRQDGCLELVGRKDLQVKIRGYRVEMEEVEIALEGLEIVREAVVVASDDRMGEKRLIAYVVPISSVEVSTPNLRASLGQLLPDYMIPARLVTLDELPLLPNGKVDRRALPPPGDARPELDVPYVAPRTPVEAEVVAIWAEVLGLDQVGIDDSFLDLGGHSLLAGRIVSRVMRAFQVDVPLSLLFESPTVADMALLITQRQAARIDAEALERLLAELEGKGEFG